MAEVTVSQMMESSGVKFGTSGARGLAEAMTDEVCYLYTQAFLQHLEAQGDVVKGAAVAIAGDFRPSTPRIMAACAKAVEDAGFSPVNCGFIPTPAVALYGIKQGIASLMVTGSHIPDDRNGIKFNKPSGEILKQDEQGIAVQTVSYESGLFSSDGMLYESYQMPAEISEPLNQYIQRYVDFFTPNALKGKNIGIYQHSTVARDVMVDICKALGANVVALGRSETFIPVDTEAVRDEDVALAAEWASEGAFDAIISADGDGDRPLVSDEAGGWLRGDVAGIVTAQFLGADAVVTPVSSNSALEKSAQFKQISRTQIGSPFVIAAMEQLLAEDVGQVVGYEANGGFLIASDITRDGRVLGALPTRDAVIVPLSILSLSCEKCLKISELLKTLPERYTFSDRLKEFPTELSQTRIAIMSAGGEMQRKSNIEKVLGDQFGEVIATDITDGLRITFDNQDVLHLRPSGNAPELRCYSESSSQQQAMDINRRCMLLLEAWRSE